MNWKMLLAFVAALSVAGCGVKNDLVMPDGKPTPKTEKDPSKPPQQSGRCITFTTGTACCTPKAST